MDQTDILTLKGKFTACQKMLTVFGDEGPASGSCSLCWKAIPTACG